MGCVACLQQEVGAQVMDVMPCERCGKLVPLAGIVAVGPGPDSGVPPTPVCRDTCVEPDDRVWEIVLKVPPRPEWN